MAAATPTEGTSDDTGRGDTIDQALESVFQELEDDSKDDELLASYRRRRLAELKSKANTLHNLRQHHYGTVQTLPSEKELITATTRESAYVLCHFYAPSFPRCSIMDRHLEALATKYVATRFVRVQGEHAPFLATKLGIRALPTVVGFSNGVVKDILVGFEGLGDRTDEFPTTALETRLKKHGMLRTDPGEAFLRGPTHE